MKKINFRKLIMMIVICLMVMFLGALSTLAAPRLVLRVSNANPTDHTYHYGLAAWSEAVEKASNGEIKLEIYDSAMLGGEQDTLDAMQMGAVDFAICNAAIFPTLVPKLNPINLPYLFKNQEHLFRALDGGLMAKINEIVEKQNAGVLTLTVMSAGTRNFYATKPIYKLADLKDLRIRVMQSDVYIKMVNLCGAKATPMAYGDIYIALQTGVIDGAENDPEAYYVEKHCEICKYFSNDAHNVDIAFLLGSTMTWNKLSAADKKIITDALPLVREASYKYQLTTVAKFTDLAKKLGCTFIDVDKEEFKNAVMPLWKSITDEYGSELVDIVKTIE
jgi:tripartite ATP-independent transporter DctP family solute receptor